VSLIVLAQQPFIPHSPLSASSALLLFTKNVLFRRGNWASEWQNQFLSLRAREWQSQDSNWWTLEAGQGVGSGW
jgi:hypothetical protein